METKRRNLEQEPNRRKRRLAAITVGVVAVGTLALSVGAYATFTDTQSASPTIGSGTVTLAPIGVSGANNRLSIGASPIAAGDTMQRAVNIKNTGTLALSTVTLTTSATTSTLLDTDVTDGLQVVIEKCSVAWTESGPPYTYTCGGTTTTMLASVPVVGSNRTLSSLNIGAGVDNFARVTLTLPTAAGNTFQNLTSILDFSFTATQRAGAPQ